MPLQAPHRTERCHRQVENGFEGAGVVLLLVVADGVGLHLLEEARGRELLWIPNDDYLSSPSDRAEGIFRAKLRGLVHDDDVEVQSAAGKVLRDGHGTHHEAGLERLDGSAGSSEERTHRERASLERHLVLKQGELRPLALGPHPVARGHRCREESARKLPSVELEYLPVELLKPRLDGFVRRPRMATESRIRLQDLPSQRLEDARVDRRREVVVVDSGGVIGCEDGAETSACGLVHRTKERRVGGQGSRMLECSIDPPDEVGQELAAGNGTSSMEVPVRTVGRTAPRMDGNHAMVDGPRALAALQKNRAELKLDTADLCFLLGLRLRAERSAIAAFEEETLLDVYEQICDLAEPDAANPRKRATHAIERFRQQRLLARVDGNGAVQAGEYSMTPLATAIVDFFLEEDALTKESLTLLTRTLIASVAEILAAARRAVTPEGWRADVIAPLRVTVSDLVSGIERRQRGLDAQQEGVRKGISALLTSDWFTAIERCEALLEETASTLAELNEVLLRDTSQMQALLQDIEQLASDCGAQEAAEASRRVCDQVERVLAWGQARQRGWSDYYQFVHRYLRDVVRLDPKRALSQRLRDQLVTWPHHPFALLTADERSIRLLRSVEPPQIASVVARPREDRDIVLDEVVEDPSAMRLEDMVRNAVASGARTLSEVLDRVLPELPRSEGYVSAGRAAAQVAALAEKELEREWVALQTADFVIEEWRLTRRRSS